MDEAFDVALPPSAVIDRVRGATNLPTKRVLGFKVARDHVSVVARDRFEVWERRQHAVHLLGVVRATPGGSRVELRTGLTLRARVLIALFLVLVAAVAYGFATLPRERSLPELTPVLSGAAIATAVAWVWWMRWQEGHALRSFVRGLFHDAGGDRA